MSTATSAILYAATVAVPNLPSGRPDDTITEDKAHHVKGGSFQNPWDSYAHRTVSHMTREMIKRRWHGESNSPDTTPPTVPVQKPTFLPTRETPKLRATWLGHACFLVEFPGGLRVLFDPVFEDRCSPFSFFGPKRYTEPPCKISDIPFIDAVVISHNHYDHLSHPTTQEIKKRHPNIHFFVPLGNKQWFLKSGISNVTELDWWDEIDLTLSPSSAPSTERSPSDKPSSISSVNSASSSAPSPSPITAHISCLPSQHTSARTPFDRDHTLWASWSIKSGPSSSSLSSSSTPAPPPSSVYFAGDTGYRSVVLPASPLSPPLPPETSPSYTDYIPSLSHLPTNPSFRSIGLHRGPFDLGLIPIGAYSPRTIMSSMHANPQDAVRIFRDTRCKRAIGMHWGTWVLTEEDVLEPKRRLGDALRELDLDPGVDLDKPETVFGVTDIGESKEF